MSWSAVFPRLNQDTDAVWRAFAWMESAGATVAFHGHTHVQMVWVWEPATNRLRSFTRQERLLLAPETRALIGVGSAGAPEDGPWPRYAIYDDVARTVLLRCVRDG
jgi:diadenosine tetraphosphatase ApaH/serine/threonine PP2A family protein phosphatase